jgi:hypothetical protein
VEPPLPPPPPQAERDPINERAMTIFSGLINHSY